MKSFNNKVQAADRYLSFCLMDEEYCIEILKVKEIMAMVNITKIPQTPPFIQGVINLRGDIVPIIDLRLRFEMDFKEYTERTTIIIVELDYKEQKTLLGIAVDAIREVIIIPEERRSAVPYINSRIKSDYIKGIAELNNTIRIMLDIDMILSEEEKAVIKELNREADKEERNEA